MDASRKRFGAIAAGGLLMGALLAGCGSPAGTDTAKQAAGTFAVQKYGGTVSSITGKEYRGHSEVWVVNLVGSSQGAIAVLIDKKSGNVAEVLPADARPSAIPTPVGSAGPAG